MSHPEQLGFFSAVADANREVTQARAEATRAAAAGGAVRHDGQGAGHLGRPDLPVRTPVCVSRRRRPEVAGPGPPPVWDRTVG